MVWDCTSTTGSSSPTSQSHYDAPQNTREHVYGMWKMLLLTKPSMRAGC